MHKFVDFVEKFCFLGENAFLQHFPMPLLLIEKISKTSQKSTYGTIHNLDIHDVPIFGKRLRETPAGLSIVYDFNSVKQAYIISVGRTEGNSITLKDHSMSKFHAYFQNSGEEWIVVDAGSSNGTFLNGEPLIAKEPYYIKSHDGICFSTVYLATFFLAKDFYQYVHSLDRENFTF